MIDFRNIETFFLVSTLGSFSAAADKLSTTQPTISQRIAALEKDLGVQLFARDARGVRLTAKGHELLSHAERILQARSDMVQAAREQNAFSGTMRIGVAETIVQTWLSTLIEQLHAAYPELVVEIEVDTSHVMRTHLQSRRLDLAFMMGPVLEERFQNLPLCTYPLAWVASPRLALHEAPVSLKRIGRLPILTYPANSSPYLAVREMLTRAGVATPRMYGSASLSMIVRMTLDGIGPSVIAPVFLGHELQTGALRRLDVQAGPLPDLSFTATWLDGPDSYPLRVIAEMAQRVAAAHAEQGVGAPAAAQSGGQPFA